MDENIWIIQHSSLCNPKSFDNLATLLLKVLGCFPKYWTGKKKWGANGKLKSVVVLVTAVKRCLTVWFTNSLSLYVEAYVIYSVHIYYSCLLRTALEIPYLILLWMRGRKPFNMRVFYLLENRAVQIILWILIRKAFLVNVLFASQSQLLKTLL